jgi:hypothetical protein
MKLKVIYIIVFLFLVVFGCKKDLGNYDYTPPSEPQLTDFRDATFDAVLGDTLIIKPDVVIDGADPLTDLTYDWEIEVPEDARGDKYQGYPLKMVYNLAPRLRTAKLTISDKRNGMKYTFPFKIQGTTPFSVGQTVLSVDNGVTKLSFVKEDGVTVLSDIYRSLHGVDLPANAVQLFAKPLVYQGGTVEDYWVVCQDNLTGGVIIDASSMLKKKNFNTHFLITPGKLEPSYFDGSAGFPVGVINGKLYLSITTTAPFAPDFGKFANAEDGDYDMSPFFTFAQGRYYFGFDKKSKAFISFNASGGFTGVTYKVGSTEPAFDPKNLGLDNLIFMRAVSGNSYAYFRTPAGETYELAFNLAMDDYNNRTITPRSKKVFKGSSLVKADSKWVKSQVDIFYFSSEDKIYRYNPINEDIRQLTADLGGKKVTMLQLSADGNSLRVGVPGAVHTLDVRVGETGKIIHTVSGIPGNPIDLVVKNN